jgi:hypothetical protein
VTDQSQANQKSAAVPLAVDIGWTMAVLFSTMREPFPQARPTVEDRLPTEHELAPADRRALEIGRVNTLLNQLAELLNDSLPQSGVPNVQADCDDKALTQTNLVILEWLAREGREFGIAYQLGRSLRDTADPPLRPAEPSAGKEQQEFAARVTSLKTAPSGGGGMPAEDRAKSEWAARDALVKQLSRARVSTLQDWLSAVMPDLPPDSGAIVSASIGRWGDLVNAIFDPNSPGRLRRFKGRSELDVAGELTTSLLRQGDAWINLLVGAESSQGLLTPEGDVAAGEAALGRTARIVKRIAAHYWFLLVIMAAALGGVLYFAASGIGGAGRAWTQIGAVASTLGLTYKGIANAALRISKQAEKPIFGLEKIDAMAWAVTTIPAEIKLDFRGTRELRRTGVFPPGPMGGS